MVNGEFGLATIDVVGKQERQHPDGAVLGCGSWLSTLAKQGVLCLFSVDPSFHCTSCKLGKQIQLSYSSSTSRTRHPFALVCLGHVPFASKDGHKCYAIFILLMKGFNTLLLYIEHNVHLCSVHAWHPAFNRRNVITPMVASLSLPLDESVDNGAYKRDHSPQSISSAWEWKQDGPYGTGHLSAQAKKHGPITIRAATGPLLICPQTDP